METEFTNPNITENDTFRRCMSCANACIVEDRDVGIWPYPDDCKAIKGYAPYSRNGVLKLGRGTMPGEIFRDMDTNPKFCAWYARQYPIEFLRNRCTTCNSPLWKVVLTGEVCAELDEVDEIEVECLHCGERRFEDKYDLAYTVSEPEGY